MRLELKGVTAIRVVDYPSIRQPGRLCLAVVYDTDSGSNVFELDLEAANYCQLPKVDVYA